MRDPTERRVALQLLDLDEPRPILIGIASRRRKRLSKWERLQQRIFGERHETPVEIIRELVHVPHSWWPEPRQVPLCWGLGFVILCEALTIAYQLWGRQ